jgi:DNA-binding SARP family transcriptional activator/tetratricopeptide (TPR) repeat protein
VAVPVLDVSLLGGFGLRFDDDPVPPIPSRVGRSLLALLVLHRDRPHARDRLAATFWPDLPEPQARRRLSHTLWQIQDVLGELPVDEPFLDVTSHAISIHRDAPIRVDAEVFAEGAERHRPEPGRPPDLAALERVVDLYGGDLLAGYDDDWLVPDRARFQSLYLDALGWLVDAAKAQGVFEDALVYARRLTNHDPLREDAHREVMRLCMLLGRPPEALRQYERCRSVLAEELGAEPSRATVDLAEQIQQQRHAPSAPPVRVDPARLRLVGRDRERGVLVGELERALGGRTCHVLLEGAPGIGKSRLVDQVVEDARWRGFAVGRSVCDIGGGWPYLALAEALEDALTPIRVAQLRARVDPIWLNEIGRIIPQLRLGDPPAVLGPRESASRMQEAFVQVLVALVEMVPLTLIVEDVHHVDRETLPVLHRFLDRVRDRRCCVVLTYRSQEARDLPHAWDHLRALDAVAVPERLQLQPLTAFDVGELARELLPPPVGQDLVARLHADTGGNPLFVLETLRALGEHTAGHADVGGMPLPATIVDVVRDRVVTLDPDVQAVLSTAAVQAVGVDLDTLAEALEGTADRLGEALHVLVGRSLLVETSEGYAFAHEQIRRVIVDMLDDDQRARLHRRVADALLQVHPDRQRDIARHLEAGGRVREAVGACRQAAAAAVALHAWRTALHDLDRAARLQRQGPASVEQQIDLLLELEAVLDVVGERERQEAALDELAALVGDDRHRTTEVARRRAWMLAQTGRMDGGEEAAARAVDTAPDGHARTAALTALGTIRSWLGDLPGARSALEDAIAAGMGSPDEAKARIALGDVYRIQQDHAAARDVLETAWSLYRQWQDPQGEVRALTALSSVHLETGRTDVALDRVAESIQTCRGLATARAKRSPWSTRPTPTTSTGPSVPPWSRMRRPRRCSPTWAMIAAWPWCA